MYRLRKCSVCFANGVEGFSLHVPCYLSAIVGDCALMIHPKPGPRAENRDESRTIA